MRDQAEEAKAGIVQWVKWKERILYCESHCPVSKQT